MSSDVPPHDGNRSVPVIPADLRPDRRRFLKWSGVAAAALMVGCDESPLAVPMEARSPSLDVSASNHGVTLDFSNDFGVLNYAYALEQLEAAFYIQVVANFYSSSRPAERAIFEDLRAHEIVHREFFKAALGGNAIPALDVDFSSVDFGSRGQILALTQTFEDLGVSAYNGAAKYLSNTTFLQVAGQIVSVEARHASVIRRVRGVNSAPNAFDPARHPSEVLQMADPFVTTPIHLTNVPAT